MKYALIGLAAVALLTLLPTHSGAQNADRNITLGQVNLSFYAVVGGVVQEILERRGYEVDVVEGSHAEIFPKLAAGEVDIFAAAWLPAGHAALYAPAEPVTFQIAPLYDDASFFWVVPDYVPVADVQSLSDLTKTHVRDRMPQRIVSLPEATGLTAVGREIMRDYGLGDAGYTLDAAPPAEWIGAFQAAIANEDWVVFPLWAPQWVNAAHDVRVLDDPLGSYGAPDKAWLLGHETLRGIVDEGTMTVLSAIRLSVDDVTEMDRRVNEDGATPREAAESWMADNSATVEDWLAAAR
ncbi:glycine betaine ABC transporter substrate-binding protein [Sulfitobacter sp. D35]|uniref:glycine betaine ABC transporter substrate-binding protein n=1 Tax=Sulfitobacter sp. D35 TaxID=3083252 RepID=UPI002970088C|nr:glycine betaine ABC transporter substrate-binding protein [Sulfitobacter sp. D35]MDW4497870.1 glycine betaine ABC transporter substrate-binding protein [Sulfitobacter sp. D35]